MQADTIQKPKSVRLFYSLLAFIYAHNPRFDFLISPELLSSSHHNIIKLIFISSPLYNWKFNLIFIYFSQILFIRVSLMLSISANNKRPSDKISFHLTFNYLSAQSIPTSQSTNTLTRPHHVRSSVSPLQNMLAYTKKERKYLNTENSTKITLTPKLSPTTERQLIIGNVGKREQEVGAMRIEEDEQRVEKYNIENEAYFICIKENEQEKKSKSPNVINYENPRIIKNKSWKHFQKYERLFAELRKNSKSISQKGVSLAKNKDSDHLFLNPFKQNKSSARGPNKTFHQRNKSSYEKVRKYSYLQKGQEKFPGKKDNLLTPHPQQSYFASRDKRLSFTPKKLSPHINKQDKKANSSKQSLGSHSFFASKKSVNRFFLLRLIESSNFLQAYQCLDKKTFAIFCLRKIKKSFLAQDPILLDQFIKKVKFQMSLQNPNIIKIYDIFADREFVYVLEEYMEGGDLRDYINRQKENYFLKINAFKKQNFQREETVILKFINLSLALNQIHHNKYHQINNYHGDLRPQTIFMSFDECKISLINAAKRQKPVNSISLYISPEQLAGHPMTDRSDIWNLGLIMFELCVGRSLLRFNSNQNLTDQIINMSIDRQISYINFISSGFKQVLRDLMKIRPQQRLDSGQILKLPILQISISLFKQDTKVCKKQQTETDSKPNLQEEEKRVRFPFQKGLTHQETGQQNRRLTWM